MGGAGRRPVRGDVSPLNMFNDYLDKIKDFLRVIGEEDDKMYEAYISLRD